MGIIFTNFWPYFWKEIQSNPSTGEAWKRRGHAREALGEV